MISTIFVKNTEYQTLDQTYRPIQHGAFKIYQKKQLSQRNFLRCFQALKYNNIKSDDKCFLVITKYATRSSIMSNDNIWCEELPVLCCWIENACQCEVCLSKINEHTNLKTIHINIYTNVFSILLPTSILITNLPLKSNRMDRFYMGHDITSFHMLCFLCIFKSGCKYYSLHSTINGLDKQFSL